MKTLFIDDEIKYIGSQLAPHWIYKNFKIQGDAIVAFCGECEVKLTEMVDIEDVINNEPIYSKYMLSFITEQFNVNLVEGVLRQRLLVTCIKEALEKKGIDKFLISEVTFVPNNYISLDEETTEKVTNLIDALTDLDDVQAVYHNLEI